MSPASLCWSSAHLVLCGPDEPSWSWTPIWVMARIPDHSLNWTARSSAIQGGQRCQCCNSPTWRWPSQNHGLLTTSLPLISIPHLVWILGDPAKPRLVSSKLPNIRLNRHKWPWRLNGKFFYIQPIVLTYYMQCFFQTSCSIYLKIPWKVRKYLIYEGRSMKLE